MLVLKKVGKIKNYDGFSGTIVDNEGVNYILLKDDLLDDVKVGDLVVFESEVYETIEIRENMARFVRKKK